MKLHSLLQDYTEIHWDIEIKDLSLNSQEVKPGDLFFALSGAKTDGKKYIHDAIQKGAVAICTEDPLSLPDNDLVPIISIQNLKQKLGLIAAKFYGFPSRNMFIIGVTGTNGKTSITRLIANAFHELNKKSATIGTIGYGVFDQPLIELNNTTPDAIQLQKILAEFKKEHVEIVAMEVSSHALDQCRVNGIDFQMGIFTNLTHDHLDYHGSLLHYAKAKKLLFEKETIKTGIFNLDDPVGFEWFNTFSSQFDVLGYGIHTKDEKAIRAENIRLQSNGVSVFLKTPWGERKIKSQLLGFFNVSNLLAVISALGALGISFEKIIDIIPHLKPVCGRLQTLGGHGENPLVVVDYAHTPDALMQALQSLREHCQGMLICVFGCGGDRDKTKRPIMASIAEQWADIVIVSDDNPRTESAHQIVNDILAGFKNPKPVIIEHDREKAIQKAIALSHKNDIVLLAGKGHENYQIIGTDKIHSSDIEIAEKCLDRKRFED